MAGTVCAVSLDTLFILPRHVQASLRTELGAVF